MRRGYFFSRLIVLLASGIVIAAMAAASMAADKVRFGTSLKESPLYALPFLAAEENGFWKEKGLEVEWVPFTGGPPLAQAMAAGSVDLALSSMVGAIEIIARKVPQIIVADMKGKEEVSLWVRRGSPIKTVNDLKGTRLGVARFGSLSEASARTVLRALGLEKEVKLVAAGGPAPVTAALKSGAIDGAFSTVFTMVPLKYGGEIREVLSVTDYLPKKWSALAISARNAFLREKAEVVKKTMAAFIQATDYIRNNPQWAIAKMKAFSGYTEEAARGTYKDLTFYSKDGKMDKEAVENIINFLIEYGLMPKEKKPPLELLYTREITG